MYQVNSRNYDLSSEYGQIFWDDIKNQSEIHWKDGWTQNTQKAMQNDQMMTKCILAWHIKAVREQLLVAKHNYMLNDKGPVNPTIFLVTGMLYNKGMRLPTLHASVININTAFQDNKWAVWKYCVQVNGDIEKFNSYFMKKLQSTSL